MVYEIYPGSVSLRGDLLEAYRLARGVAYALVKEGREARERQVENSKSENVVIV